MEFRLSYGFEIGQVSTFREMDLRGIFESQLRRTLGGYLHGLEATNK